MITSDHSTLDSEAIGFAVEAARLAEDRHCTDVRVLDVRGLSQVCDFVLLASGTSDRQSRSVASEFENLAKTYGLVRLHSTRDEASTWTLVDFASVVAHIFEPSRRAYYDLEDLWHDAPEIDFARDQENAS